jgi:LysM repeat protein
VADAIGVTLAVVANLNPELTKGCTPPGQTYGMRIPKGNSERFQTNFAALPDEKKYLKPEELSRRKFKDVYFIYTIKSGDSLYKIGAKYHIPINKIKRWNPSIARDKYIHPGSKIRIYRGE